MKLNKPHIPVVSYGDNLYPYPDDLSPFPLLVRTMPLWPRYSKRKYPAECFDYLTQTARFTMYYPGGIPATPAQRAVWDKWRARTRLAYLAQFNTTVYAQVDHMSKSGMLRRINFYMVENHMIVGINHLIESLTHYKTGKSHNSIAVHGCGMNMCWAVVNDLATSTGIDLHYSSL